MSDENLKDNLSASTQAAKKEEPRALEKPQTADDIKRELEGVLATGYTPVYVNSLGKEVGFKEISV